MLMPVNVAQWCMKIDAQQNFLVQVTCLPKNQVTVIFTLLLLFMLEDVQLNPGPNKNNSSRKFSVCHWNLNSLATHNFEQVGALEAYNTINKFDIICVSESYLDSTFSTDSKDINIKGYKLVRANHPTIQKEEVFVSILEKCYQFG